MSTNQFYKVLVGEFAKRHFIKSFEKKHKSLWFNTFPVIENMLMRIEGLLLSSKAEIIHICDIGKIVKCKFKIIGSNISAKESGNRIIVFVDDIKNELTILLLYAKNHIVGSHETVWWEGELKSKYKEICSLFSGLK